MIEIVKVTDVMNCLDGLKAIVFDLDDTLYNEKDYVRSGFDAIEKAHGISSAAFWDAFKDGKAAIDAVLYEVGKTELKEECLKTYRCHEPNIELSNDIKKLLFDLKEMGIFLGLITDGRPEGQWAKINALDIKEVFDKIIITDELGGTDYRKPNSFSFEIMQKCTDALFSEMAYVGDNIEKDFLAPEKLGMKSIWFRNKDGIYYI